MAGWAILVVKIIVFELLFQKFERYKPKISTTGFDWSMLLLPEVSISNSKKVLKIQVRDISKNFEAT